MHNEPRCAVPEIRDQFGQFGVSVEKTKVGKDREKEGTGLTWYYRRVADSAHTVAGTGTGFQVADGCAVLYGREKQFIMTMLMLLYKRNGYGCRERNRNPFHPGIDIKKWKKSSDN